MSSASCSVDGCDQPVRVKSERLCSSHYRRLRRTGDTGPAHFWTECSDPHCERRVRADSITGLCPRHYRRASRGYASEGPIRVWGRDFLTRLREDVTISESGCWEWQGTMMQNGYGRVRYEGAEWYTHRLAWTLANGPIPDGLLVMHACDNRRCVNVGHLSLGTVADNAADMVAKGRGRGRYSA